MNMSFFSHMSKHFTRTLHHICREAASQLLARSTEVLFEKGDACSGVYFVEQGELRYGVDTNLKKQMFLWATTTADLTSKLDNVVPTSIVPGPRRSTRKASSVKQ